MGRTYGSSSPRGFFCCCLFEMANQERTPELPGLALQALQRLYRSLLTETGEKQEWNSPASWEWALDSLNVQWGSKDFREAPSRQWRT
jgi:hypothetical protein